MDAFTKVVLKLLNEGQTLSVSDRLLAGHIITSFIEDYTASLGYSPKPLFGTIHLIAPRLEEYGFQMPRVERWRKMHMRDLQPYINRRKR